LRSGTRTLQYDEHLSAVNTVTFLESGRKFVSTSDDKKIFIWEFGIPVVVKHMSEPDMHAITQTAMHPSYNYFAGQSSDNYIKIYETKVNNGK
jgi:pre-mRNA-processing factor 17